MPSPSYLNTSLWTPGEARLVAVGGIDLSKGGKAECKDKYAFILAPGERPLSEGSSANVTGLPAYGADHPSCSGLSVSQITFEQAGDQSPVWYATVSYSAGESNSGDQTDDSKYTRLHIGYVNETRELTWDADHPEGSQNPKPVVNAAGDPFETVPMVERPLMEIQITRNQSASPSGLVNLNNTVNDAAVTVAGFSVPAKCGRLSIEADRNFGGSFAWTVNFRIVVNPATWDIEVLNNGYRYLETPSLGLASNKVKFTETTADGRVVECSTPQLLGLDGSKGDSSNRIYYLKFAAYNSAPWAALKLPASL